MVLLAWITEGVAFSSLIAFFAKLSVARQHERIMLGMQGAVGVWTAAALMVGAIQLGMHKVFVRYTISLDMVRG
jgi:hypothetical protein